MQDDEHTSIAVELSRQKEERPTEIGGFTVCANGLKGKDDGRARQPVQREEVEVVKNFLSRCRPTRWVRQVDTPSASELSLEVAAWPDKSLIGRISTGAVMVAALELGILCVPDGESDALIGVNFEDVRALGGTINPLAPETQDDVWQKYLQEKGFIVTVKFMDAIASVPPLEWAVLDRILKRQVTLLYGDGAIGKSLLALLLLCATVLGRDWIGTKPEPGPCIYLGAEDEQDEIHRRLDAIAAHYGETVSALIDNGLYASSYAGQDMTLARFDSDGDIEATPLFTALWEQAQKIRPVIIVLDTLSDIFDGDENNRGQVSAFVGLLRRLAIAANCAVIVNAHPSQSGSNTGTSGSTAWHGKVRGRLHLRAANKDEGGLLDPDLRVLEFKKIQYGPLAPKIMLRYQNGVLIPEMCGGSPDQQVVEQRAEQVFLTLLDRITREGRNATDKRGTSFAPALFAKEPEAKAQKLNKNALADAMLRLFASGKIKVVTEGPKSKQRSRIVTT